MKKTQRLGECWSLHWFEIKRTYLISQKTLDHNQTVIDEYEGAQSM